MTSVPDLMDIFHRHILFSLLLDPKTPGLVPVSAPNPVRVSPACRLPTNLHVTWHSLTLSLPVTGQAVVLGWWWLPGLQARPSLGVQGLGQEGGVEPRAAGAWLLLLGRRRDVKGNSHRPPGRGPAGQDGAGQANAGQRGKLHSYSTSPCVEFYFSFYLFLLLKSCFSP